jgi:hypothetical protein
MNTPPIKLNHVHVRRLVLFPIMWGLSWGYTVLASETLVSDNRVGKPQKETAEVTYKIVDTEQIRCFDNRVQIKFPQEKESFFGQDAHYQGNTPTYTDNGDGTVSDEITGLMWQSDPGHKMTFEEAVKGASKCNTGGHSDWRLPSIKELFSLILFNGLDPDMKASDPSTLKPFIDTSVFNFSYGDPSKHERIIDSQFATSTKYVHTTMGDNETMFGVNFADGRIKGYPLTDPRSRRGMAFYVLYVRGNPDYGNNHFIKNAQKTVTDRATGLTWMLVDSGHLRAGKNNDGKLNWQEALAWSEGLDYGGHSDWRLPNVKELQSIVDYTRSPATTNSAAIDPVFKVSRVKEGQEDDFPYYWTSTTHQRGNQGSAADYICFGKGYGWMFDHQSRKKKLMDVHGAGCQRSDPKSGDPSLTPQGRGPQGDVLRINNFVRCVRGGEAKPVTSGPNVEKSVVKPRRGREPRPEGQRPDIVSRLDKNNDGKVSKSEFDGPGRHFSHIDKNNDGFLSEKEFRQGPPPKPPGRP